MTPAEALAAIDRWAALGCPPEVREAVEVLRAAATAPVVIVKPMTDAEREAIFAEWRRAPGRIEVQEYEGNPHWPKENR